MYSECFEKRYLEYLAKELELKGQNKGEKKEKEVHIGLREAVREKKEPYTRMIQRNIPEELQEGRKREYIDYKSNVKQVFEESKRKVDNYRKCTKKTKGCAANR